VQAASTSAAIRLYNPPQRVDPGRGRFKRVLESLEPSHPKPTLCMLSIVAVFSLLEPGPFFIATTSSRVSRFLTPVRGLRQRIQWCFLKARDSTASSSES
jgi:hypothetical protein